MPSTVNGVGTHYYGQRNVKVRTGVCRRCGAETTLKSYDTRLFIVFVFIPVFPLGRKRIIDYCQSCTGHFAMDARQWEVGGQLNATDSLDQFASDPSPETAARCHAQLLAYFQYDEAQALREQALAQFSHDGQLRADLAWQLSAAANYKEARQLFEEALARRPDLPSARVGKAQYLITENKLDEARNLLEFLMQPGAAQLYDLAPLMLLCEQFQAAGRSEDSLALAEHLLREVPHLKDDFGFRKVVSQAERAAGRGESLLPQRNRSWFNLVFSKSRDYSPAERNWARAAVLTIGVLAALALHNESVRRQRTVHIVNQTGVPAQVRIGDGAPIDVDRQAAIQVGEGTHEVHISGPVETTETLELSSGYFDRWFKRPVWVVNVNGEAILVESKVVYSAVPQPHPHPPTFHLGKTSLALPDIDYLFDEERPKSIAVKNNRDVVKTQLVVVAVPADLALSGLSRHDVAGAMTQAERRLARTGEPGLLETYCRVASEKQQQERAARFLETRLDHRPLEVEWHRAYQLVCDLPARTADLLARYERLVQSEPESAAAWYLFFRVDDNVERRDRSLTKALECDPRFSWGLFGRAHRAFSRGEFEQAVPDYAAALALQPLNDNWRTAAICNDLARQKYEAVDAACRALKAPTAALAVAQCWSQFKRGMTVDVPSLVKEATAAPESTVSPVQLTATLHYSMADWEALRKDLTDPAWASVPTHTKALFRLSTLSNAELNTEFPNIGAVTEGMDVLALELAYSLAGDAAGAANCRKHAIQRLHAGDKSDRGAAAALTGPAPPTVEAFRNSHIMAGNRSLVCVHLARQFPEQRATFLTEARVWQVFPIHPYWLVERALSEP